LDPVRSGALPADIPAAPDRAGKGWQGYGDWLGTGRTRKRRTKEPVPIDLALSEWELIAEGAIDPERVSS